MKSKSFLLALIYSAILLSFDCKRTNERELELEEAKAALNSLNSRFLTTVVSRHKAKRLQQVPKKQKVARLAKALRRIQTAKKRKALVLFNAEKGLRHHSNHKSGRKAHGKNRKLDVLENIGNVAYNAAHGIGKVTGYIPSKIGFDYSGKNDYAFTGLGTIGLSYGLYDYFSRKNKLSKLAKLLEDKYKTQGLQLVTIEEENSDLSFINRKLVYMKSKIDRAKKAISDKILYSG